MPKRRPGLPSADDINKAFGARLRYLREMIGKSQTEVGQALAVSFQQIQKYENGTTSISLNRLDELAQFFNIPVWQLLSGLGPQKQADGAQLGFAEGEQASYSMDETVPKVGPLPKDAVALLNAFARIKDRKIRRSILTIAEAQKADDELSEPSDDRADVDRPAPA